MDLTPFFNSLKTKFVFFFILFSITLRADLGHAVWIEFEMDGVRNFIGFHSDYCMDEKYKKYFPVFNEFKNPEQLFFDLLKSDVNFIGYHKINKVDKIVAWREKHWLDLSLLDNQWLKDDGSSYKAYIFTNSINLDRREIIKKGKFIHIFHDHTSGGYLSQLIKTSDNEWIRKSKMIPIFEDEIDICRYTFYAAKGRFTLKEILALKKQIKAKLREEDMNENQIFDELYKRKIIAYNFCSC